MKNNDEIALFNKSVGKRIQHVRKSKNMSQEELAGAVQLSTVSISNIENGSSGVGSYDLFQIAEALNISILYLLYGVPTEMEKGLYETFCKAEKLEKKKQDLICSLVNQLIDGLEQL